MSDLRSRMVYSRARQLFRTELPGVGWPSGEFNGDQAIVRLHTRYLARAELELFAEGIISGSF